MLASLFRLEGEDGETYEEFCARLMREFKYHSDGTPPQPAATTVAPIDLVPEGCSSGEGKHMELTDLLDAINNLLELLDFLQPRIDNADSLVVLCDGKLEEIEDLVANNFGRWTQGMSDKVDILADLHAEQGLPGESFSDFLYRIRAEYDGHKADDAIAVMDPNFDVPEVDDLCPQEVLGAHAAAEAFRGVLEDCLSYTEWLRAQAAGYCEVQRFQLWEAANQAGLDADYDRQNVLLFDLFTLKVGSDG